MTHVFDLAKNLRWLERVVDFLTRLFNTIQVSKKLKEGKRSVPCMCRAVVTTEG